MQHAAAGLGLFSRRQGQLREIDETARVVVRGAAAARWRQIEAAIEEMVK